MAACSCANWLNQYNIYWVAKPQSYVNHDYIRATGALIDSRDSDVRILNNHLVEDMERIDAFTWAEVQRCVEFRGGNDERKPQHRILINGKEWQPCHYKNPLAWMNL